MDFRATAREDETRNYMSAGNLSKERLNQTSGASLPGISERDRLPLKPQVNKSQHDDSLAHPDRPTIRIEGLTDFLRKEYYRRMGVYCNGANDEEDKLTKFWFNNVSTDGKKEY